MPVCRGARVRGYQAASDGKAKKTRFAWVPVLVFRYQDYYKAHGKPWLSLLNRPKPVLGMWPAEAVGQRHTVRFLAAADAAAASVLYF